MTVEGIIASPTVDGIGIAVASQGIGKSGAGEVFKVTNDVARSIPTRAGTGGEVDANSGCRVGIGKGVIVSPTVEAVSTSATLDRVIASKTKDDIGGGATSQVIGKTRAG